MSEAAVELWTVKRDTWIHLLAGSVNSVRGNSTSLWERVLSRWKSHQFTSKDEAPLPREAYSCLSCASCLICPTSCFSPAWPWSMLSSFNYVHHTKLMALQQGFLYRAASLSFDSASTFIENSFFPPLILIKSSPPFTPPNAPISRFMPLSVTH